MSERLASIKGYEEYKVGSMGNVYHFGKKLSPWVTNAGYLQIRLYSNLNGRKNLLIHRLVAMAFVGNRTKGANEVDHKNRNRRDNRASNLKWSTRSENNLNRDFPTKHVQ